MDFIGVLYNSKLSCMRDMSCVLMRSTPLKLHCIGIASRLSKLMASYISTTSPNVVGASFSCTVATSFPNNALVQSTLGAISSSGSSNPNPQLNKRNCVDLHVLGFGPSLPPTIVRCGSSCAGCPTWLFPHPHPHEKSMKNIKPMSHSIQLHQSWPT